jgi:hypothetical protein
MAWANCPACGAFGTLGLVERVEVLAVRAVGLAAGQDRLGELGPGARVGLLGGGAGAALCSPWRGQRWPVSPWSGSSLRPQAPLA